MSKCLRLLMMAAALSGAAAASAAAQTVVVRGAAPGETVEVVVNDAPARTATVGSDGTATVVGTIPPNESKRAEMDARLYVDSCDRLRRVLVVGRNLLPSPPQAGCARSEVGGIYWVRQRSTIVVDVSQPIPDVLLRQGVYDPNAPVRRLAPKGLVAFGGGGLAKASEAAIIACGDVATCEGNGYVGAYNVGATLWVTRWLGVEGSYLRPSRMTVNGGGTSFSFTERLDVDIVNAVGKVGVPIGPVRIYGQAGGTYHDAVNAMTQTIADASQTVETHTDGWSYTFGGGLEGWISERLALYGDVGFTKIKGKDRRTGTIEINDRLTHYTVGVRFRIF